MHRSIVSTLCSVLLVSSHAHAQRAVSPVVPPRVVRVVEPQFPVEMQGRTAPVAVGLILDIDSSGRVSSASAASAGPAGRRS